MRSQSVSSRVITVSLAIIVMLTLAAFFLTNMGGAQQTVALTEADGGQCQADCRDIITLAFNFKDCEALYANQKAIDYVNECVDNFGPCTVTVKDSVTCVIQ